MRLRIFLKPGTVMLLVVRKSGSKDASGWLAGRLRISKTLATRMLRRSAEVPDGMPPKILRLFSGLTTERYKRVGWDDLFESDLVSGRNLREP